MSVTHGLRQQSRFHKRYSKQADEYDKKRHGGPNPTSTCVSFLPSARTSLTIVQDAECRSRFYEVYHKQSQEYDREFAKKYDDDLDTTLIFVNLRSHPENPLFVDSVYRLDFFRPSRPRSSPASSPTCSPITDNRRSKS